MMLQQGYRENFTTKATTNLPPKIPINIIQIILSLSKQFNIPWHHHRNI
jgi:hypothetical protein